MALTLRMRRPHLEDLPPPRWPPGYTVRTFRQEDEATWLGIIRAAFPEMDWSLERFHQTFLSQPQFDPDSLFFACFGEEAVGTALAWIPSPSELEGVVHWVGVVPAHQGRGLGKALTLQVLHRLRALGMRSARLGTEEERLPAIRLYLDLGFEPLPLDETHRQAWEQVMLRLAHLRRR